MEFDYGSVVRHDVYADPNNADPPSDVAVEREQSVGHEGEAEDARSSPTTVSTRARDLFSEGSCAWTEYYTDQNTLEKVGRLYSADFDLFGWYDLDSWRERLDACLKERE